VWCVVCLVSFLGFSIIFSVFFFVIFDSDASPLVWTCVIPLTYTRWHSRHRDPVAARSIPFFVDLNLKTSDRRPKPAWTPGYYLDISLWTRTWLATLGSGLWLLNSGFWLLDLVLSGYDSIKTWTPSPYFPLLFPLPYPHSISFSITLKDLPVQSVQRTDDYFKVCIAHTWLGNKLTITPVSHSNRNKRGSTTMHICTSSPGT
jgi:hypothetical protein